MQATLSKKQSILFMVLTSFMWSLAGLFIKLIDWHPVVIATLRSLIGGCVIYSAMRLQGLRVVWNRRVALAGLWLCLTMLLFVTANKLTTSTNAIVLQSTSPAFVLLFGLLLGRSISKRDLLVVGVTLGGISLFFLDKLSPGGFIGNLLAIVSGITFAALLLSANRMPDQASSLSGVLLGQLFMGVLGLPFLWLAPPILKPAAVASILVLGVVQLGLSYVLYGMAIRGCPPLTASLITLIEPLFNPIWVFLVIGELPGPFALLGGAVVIATVTLAAVKD